MCQSCALIQILSPISPEELYRDFNFCFTSWKAQPHMADEITLIKENVKQDALVVEIGCNDGGFLNEMKKLGLSNIVCGEPNRVAGEIALKVGVPVYNNFFSDSIADQILEKHGQASLVVSRQVVEHIPDLSSLLRNVSRILTTDGYILFEVPDFEVPLKHGDCSALWEEHVNYFTEPVMSALLNRHGFEVKKIQRFPFSGGALLVFAKRSPQGKPVVVDRGLEIERIKTLAKGFEQRVSSFRQRLVEALEGNRAKGRPNVLYGSGCRANTLINGLQLGRYFEFIVDDQAEKQKLFMPGCHLEIKSSQSLNDAIGACFLSVNSENEDKVIRSHQNFLNKGGTFHSLNSPSPLLI